MEDNDLLRDAEGLLDRVYGDKILSVRAFLRSGLLSLIAATAAGAYGVWQLLPYLESVSGAYYWYTGLLVIPPALFACNVLFDFLSVAVSRSLLRRVRQRPSVLALIAAVVVDFTTLAVLACLPMVTGGLAVVAVLYTSATVGDGFVHDPVWHLMGIVPTWVGGSLAGTLAEPVELQRIMRVAVATTTLSAGLPTLVLFPVLCVAALQRLSNAAGWVAALLLVLVGAANDQGLSVHELIALGDARAEAVDHFGAYSAYRRAHDTGQLPGQVQWALVAQEGRVMLPRLDLSAAVAATCADEARDERTRQACHTLRARQDADPDGLRGDLTLLVDVHACETGTATACANVMQLAGPHTAYGRTIREKARRDWRAICEKRDAAACRAALLRWR